MNPTHEIHSVGVALDVSKFSSSPVGELQPISGHDSYLDRVDRQWPSGRDPDRGP